MKIKAIIPVFALFLCSNIIFAQQKNSPVDNEPIKITLPDATTINEKTNVVSDTITKKVIETTPEVTIENKVEETVAMKDSVSTDSLNTKTEDSFKFSKKGMDFRAWSVQLFLGQPLMYASTLESNFKEDFGKTYDIQLGVTRQLNHVFAIQLLGHMGKSRQYYNGSGTTIGSETKYFGALLLGDFNLSALMRKVDFKNQKYYKWALHAYGGFGTIAYKNDGVIGYSGPIDVKFLDRSVYFQFAGGLRRRINKSFDVELKQTLVVTNDSSFDGVGESALLEVRRKNGYFTGNISVTSLGVHYKIGKKESEHMAWVDPFQYLIKDNKSGVEDKKGIKEAVKDVMKEALAGKDGKDGAAGIKEIVKQMVAEAINGKDGKDGLINALGRGGKLCDKDADNDAVCDEWDREPNTPAGARIDGSGVALDVDLDTVIDLYDQCVVVPGEGNPTGCPDKQNINTQIIKDKFNSINVALEGIDFDFNSDIIKPQYFTILDQAGFVMNEFPVYKFNVEGHTDSQGSDYYNYVLSKKRAEAVKKYMMQKHSITADRLTIVPKGETDLKNPECKVHTNCTDAKNTENRRIVFVPLE